jgi:thiamine-phosphate pyrophosphorylase
VASLLIPASAGNELISLAQSKGVAVLSAGAPRQACDGVQVDVAEQPVAPLRKLLGKDAIVGAYCAASRHFAMEAAEAGADYVAFSQELPAVGGEPLVRWWADVMEIPCVAFDPVDVAGLDTLLPQKPDFIRPSDAMWEDAASARRIVSELMQRLNRP